MDEAIRIDPDYGFLYYRRGEAQLIKKNYDKAVKDFERAIERSSNFVCPYRSLAWLLATCPEENVRDGKRAIHLVRTACDVWNDGKSGWALDILAAAYAEAGHFDEAVGFQTAALQDTRQRPNWDEFRQRLELYEQKKAFRQGV